MRTHQKTFTCPICREERPAGEILDGDLIHSPIDEMIRKTNPGWSPQDVICLSCLNRLRADYVQKTLETEKGEISALDSEVLHSLKEHEVISENVNVEFDQKLTLGERIADKVAEFGGSWRFIILFGVIMGVWITLNSLALLMRPFDPFPYILLNLVLSCLAAMQAPVIMMSQNRQESKDRMRSEHDYRVNLKAELEIRQLHWKLDQLLTHQWQRLLEIQQIQMDLMEELVHKPRRG